MSPHERIDRMKTARIHYDSDAGWDEFPSLDSDRTLLTVFGASRLGDDPAIFEELRGAFPRSSIAGCSSAGEIDGSDLLDDSLTVGIARFDDVDLHSVALHSGPGVDSLQLGMQLATELRDRKGRLLSAVFVLSNGLHVNGSALIDGITGIVGPDVPVTGGLAGDDARFERTWVLHGEQIGFEQTVAIGFYGDALVTSHGTMGGWDKFGPTRRVTRSNANVLYELDNQPALDLYKLYLGEHAEELPASGLLFPLEVHPPNHPEHALVRTILSVDEDEKSLTFAGDVPEGHSAQLMKSNFDRLIDGARYSSANATETAHEGDALAIAISCVGRRLVLQDRTLEEIAAVKSHLPDGTDLVGFYSYGEIAPRNDGGPACLHNQTMTLTIFSEA